MYYSLLAETESTITVYCSFRTKYNINPPTVQTLKYVLTKFDGTGYFCVSKGSRKPGPSDENADCIKGIDYRVNVCHVTNK